jgi:hypothetical protein
MFQHERFPYVHTGGDAPTGGVAVVELPYGNRTGTPHRGGGEGGGRDPATAPALSMLVLLPHATGAQGLADAAALLRPDMLDKVAAALNPTKLKVRQHRQTALMHAALRDLGRVCYRHILLLRWVVMVTGGWGGSCGCRGSVWKSRWAYHGCLRRWACTTRSRARRTLATLPRAAASPSPTCFTRVRGLHHPPHSHTTTAHSHRHTQTHTHSHTTTQ